MLTDVSTEWTESLALRHRTSEAVVEAIAKARELLPFPTLGIDTDNGSEFLNDILMAYCTREGITITLGRAYRKNDQCFVEQKNGSIVRNVVGYDRFEVEVAHRQLTELYRAVRHYVNFFQPSMKLRQERREGAQVWRSFDRAQTPYYSPTASGRDFAGEPDFLPPADPHRYWPSPTAGLAGASTTAKLHSR